MGWCKWVMSCQRPVSCESDEGAGSAEASTPRNSGVIAGRGCEVEAEVEVDDREERTDTDGEREEASTSEACPALFMMRGAVVGCRPGLRPLVPQAGGVPVGRAGAHRRDALVSWSPLHGSR
jgi:hypothetical protein